MASISVSDDVVHVSLSPFEKLGALHDDVFVPRAAVVDAVVLEHPLRELRGIRAPGTGWPGVIALGTWRRRGGKDFVAVRRATCGVRVDLDGVEFDRLVVSCDDPDAVVAELTS